MPAHVPALPGMSPDDQLAHTRALRDYHRWGHAVDYAAAVRWHREWIGVLRRCGVNPHHPNGEDGVGPRPIPAPAPVPSPPTWELAVGVAVLVAVAAYLWAIN